jgi:hypothetical protein
MQNELDLSANELPIACNLSGPEQVKRGEEVESVFKGVEQVKELADGYAYRFPGNEEWAARLMEFVLAERRCCPFFNFELVFEPNLGSIWLQLRGGQGVKEFIAAAFSS